MSRALGLLLHSLPSCFALPGSDFSKPWMQKTLTNQTLKADLELESLSNFFHAENESIISCWALYQGTEALLSFAKSFAKIFMGRAPMRHHTPALIQGRTQAAAPLTNLTSHLALCWPGMLDAPLQNLSPPLPRQWGITERYKDCPRLFWWEHSTHPPSSPHLRVLNRNAPGNRRKILKENYNKLCSSKASEFIPMKNQIPGTEVSYFGKINQPK